MVAEIGCVKWCIFAFSADFGRPLQKKWQSSCVGRIFEFLVYKVLMKKVYLDAFYNNAFSCPTLQSAIPPRYRPISRKLLFSPKYWNDSNFGRTGKCRENLVPEDAPFQGASCILKFSFEKKFFVYVMKVYV